MPKTIITTETIAIRNTPKYFARAPDLLGAASATKAVSSSQSILKFPMQA